MRRGMRTKAGVAGLAATLAVVALGPAAAVAGSPTSLTISAYGYFGKVKSPNTSCLAGRKVALKQKSHGVLGRTTSEDNGSWKDRSLRSEIQGPAALQALRRGQADPRNARARPRRRS